MSNQNELKPCPFCGGEARLETANIKNILNAFHGSRYSIQCLRRDCYLGSFYEVGYEYKKDAVEEWNKRPIEDELRKEIAIKNLAIDKFCNGLEIGVCNMKYVYCITDHCPTNEECFDCCLRQAKEERKI